MVLLAQVDVGQSVEDALSTFLAFVPMLLAFLAILVIGWLVARVLERLLTSVLERVGFDRVVERGGVKRALVRTELDASDVLAKLVFYAVMLFVLQLAFGVFGPNPISALLFGLIAFLPKVFVAVVILVVAAAIAAAARELIDVAIGGLSYGKLLANAAAAIIVGIGVFAALNQVEIAPAVVNGLFYALLAAVVGVVVVAVGGGGIQPMRARWETALDRFDEESGRLRDEISATSGHDVAQRLRARADQAVQPAPASPDERVADEHDTVLSPVAPEPTGDLPRTPRHDAPAATGTVPTPDLPPSDGVIVDPPPESTERRARQDTLETDLSSPPTVQIERPPQAASREADLADPPTVQIDRPSREADDDDTSQDDGGYRPPAR